MVEFRQSPTIDAKKAPRNYLARREQRRVLIPFVLVGLAVVMGIRLADPNSHLRRLTGTAAPTPVVERSATPPQPARVDTRIRPKNPELAQLPLDTVIIRQEKTPRAESKGKYFPGVKPELFDSIRDFSTFRSAEHPAWFNLLGVLKNADAADLAKRARKDVGFTQVYQQPDVYRGQLITFRGTIKRALNYDAPKNEAGIEGYHQVWLFPEAPLSPIVFYVLDLPEGFPSSRVNGSDTEVRNITEKGEITGFFFKDWAYGTGSQIESAPLLLAKSITWDRQVKETNFASPVETKTMGMIVFASAALGILLAALVYRASRSSISKPLSPQAARFQASSLQSLANEDLVPDAKQALADLAAAERASEQSNAATPGSTQDSAGTSAPSGETDSR